MNFHPIFNPKLTTLAELGWNSVGKSVGSIAHGFNLSKLFYLSLQKKFQICLVRVFLCVFCVFFCPRGWTHQRPESRDLPRVFQDFGESTVFLASYLLLWQCAGISALLLASCHCYSYIYWSRLTAYIFLPSSYSYSSYPSSVYMFSFCLLVAT